MKSGVFKSLGLFLALGAVTFTVSAANELTNDASIQSTVERQFLYDANVSSFDIDVTTSDGIVTLDGTVDNLRQKNRAQRIAQAITGVQAVNNELGVAFGDRSDDEIQQDVKDALLFNTATDSYEVIVDVDDGTVRLTGTVESYPEYHLSTYVAEGVKGVREIDNQLRVDYESDRSDNEIKQDILASLDRDVNLIADYIDADVENGNVTLRGSVDSAAEKWRANYKSWVAGVKAVDDSNLIISTENPIVLRTETDRPESDSEIRRAILAGLATNPYVFSLNPVVGVENGRVTLSGTVDSLKARMEAEKEASSTQGVRTVFNYLKIRPTGEVSDEELGRNVRDALLRDVYVERHEIDVHTQDGIVYLNGFVDTQFEKGKAEEAIAPLDGVVEVRNNLKVGNPSYAYYDLDWYPFYGFNPYHPPYTVTLKSDSEIKADIDSELFWSPFVDSDEVEVEVEAGNATLRGTVDTWYEYGAADENAREGGAIGVTNRLEVEDNS